MAEEGSETVREAGLVRRRLIRSALRLSIHLSEKHRLWFYIKFTKAFDLKVGQTYTHSPNN
jgi:hypothetical protein